MKFYVWRKLQVDTVFWELLPLGSLSRKGRSAGGWR